MIATHVHGDHRYETRLVIIRIRVATRLTAAVVIASLGALVGSIGPGQGEASAFLGGVLVRVIALFVAFVVALEGVVVLVERVVESALERERTGDAGPDRSPE